MKKTSKYSMSRTRLIQNVVEYYDCDCYLKSSCIWFPRENSSCTYKIFLLLSEFLCYPYGDEARANDYCNKVCFQPKKGFDSGFCENHSCKCKSRFYIGTLDYNRFMFISYLQLWEI